MQLNKLHITRSEYGQDKGQLHGHVEFAGPHGKVELPLDEILSQEIVSVCAEGIARMSRQIAENMTAEIIEGLVALPAE